MRKNIIILLILTAILILGCTDEYEIIVINKSSYPINFNFITGHRLNENIHLEPEEEWHYFLLKSLGHSMGTFTSPPETNVDYSYSEYVYTFYDVILPPDENGEPDPETEPESEP